MNVYFMAGYLPAYDLEAILGLLNWCAERGFELVFMGQAIQPGSIAGPRGQTALQISAVPYMKTTKENFEILFNRPWDLSKVGLIPGELSKLMAVKPLNSA